MIAYDDLVAALTAWRARQGLPVEDRPAAPAAPPVAPPAPPPRIAARAGSSPAAAPAPAPASARPPTHGGPAGRSRSSAEGAPPHDPADELLGEDGGDFALTFSAPEPTAVGVPPPPRAPASALDADGFPATPPPPPPRRGGGGAW
jgi:hypothetical protein